MANIGAVEVTSSVVVEKRGSMLSCSINENCSGSLSCKVPKAVVVGRQYDSSRVTAEKGSTVTSAVVKITAEQIVGPRKHPLEIAWKKAQIIE